jgi:hypothetical protein
LRWNIKSFAILSTQSSPAFSIMVVSCGLEDATGVRGNRLSYGERHKNKKHHVAH